jgi:hypothetical protein
MDEWEDGGEGEGGIEAVVDVMVHAPEICRLNGIALS